MLTFSATEKPIVLKQRKPLSEHYFLFGSCCYCLLLRLDMICRFFCNTISRQHTDTERNYSSAMFLTTIRKTSLHCTENLYECTSSKSQTPGSCKNKDGRVCFVKQIMQAKMHSVKSLAQAELFNSKLWKLLVIVKGQEEMPRSTDAILSLERQQPWLNVEINVEVP